MNRPIVDAFFALLRGYATGTGRVTEEQKNTARENLAPLYSLAVRHDLAHLLGHALFEEGVTDDSEATRAFEKQQMLAIFRYEGFAFEIGQVEAALEAAEIPFVILKGSVLRGLYPEPWMRTSCDVDVLVRPEDHAAAEACLTERLGYRREGEGDHDVTLVSEGGVHVELHFALVEERRAGGAFELLCRVWDYAAPREGFRFNCALADEFFYFYHVAHMAKHFAGGGCGVRSFLDLWFLEQMNHDETARDALLAEGGLLSFAAEARRLCRLWFSGEETADAPDDVARFVLFGGVYGSKDNYVAIQQKKRGGRVGYILARMFLPYREMRYLYPILQKCPVLLPVFWVWRWIDHLVHGGAKRSLRELERNRTLTPEERDATASMLSRLGLSE